MWLVNIGNRSIFSRIEWSFIIVWIIDMRIKVLGLCKVDVYSFFFVFKKILLRDNFELFGVRRMVDGY